MQAFGEHTWPNRFEIFHGNLSDALKFASVVLSSNSGSMVEAAARGIPIIYIGRQTALNHNILSSLNMDVVNECFSASELVETIKKYINSPPNEKMNSKEMGKKVCNLFFVPVNEKTLLPFLDIEGN
jgi:predicted glycosyltransferase